MEPFSTKEALSYGWKTTKEHLWYLVGFFLAVFLISMASAYPPLAIIVGIFVEISIITMMLRLYAGEPIPWKSLFSKYHLFLQYLVIVFLYGVMVVLGLILFIIPGIYLAIRFQFGRLIMVERELKNPIDALKESSRVTKGSMWKLFKFFIVACILNILGALAFGVGLFLSIPTTFLAYVYIYKKLSNRSLSTT